MSSYKNEWSRIGIPGVSQPRILFETSVAYLRKDAPPFNSKRRKKDTASGNKVVPSSDPMYDNPDYKTTVFRTNNIVTILNQIAGYAGVAPLNILIEDLPNETVVSLFTNGGHPFKRSTSVMPTEDSDEGIREQIITLRNKKGNEIMIRRTGN